MNLLQIIFLALLGLSAGMIVAGGVFSFIVELGAVSYTHLTLPTIA